MNNASCIIQRLVQLDLESGKSKFSDVRRKENRQVIQVPEIRSNNKTRQALKKQN